jgi:hypothetical protein
MQSIVHVRLCSLLAHRFDYQFISSACRSFICLYLSKLRGQSVYPYTNELVEQDDGTRISIMSILDMLCIWYREFSYRNDQAACKWIRTKLAACRCSSLSVSIVLRNLDEKIQWSIYQSRAKYLEKQRMSMTRINNNHNERNHR